MKRHGENREAGGWIPAAERMPQEHGTYIITFENESGRHSDAAIYNPASGTWFWDDDEASEVKRKILAWRPLPAPYQADHGDNNAPL